MASFWSKRRHLFLTKRRRQFLKIFFFSLKQLFDAHIILFKRFPSFSARKIRWNSNFDMIVNHPGKTQPKRVRFCQSKGVWGIPNKLNGSITIDISRLLYSAVMLVIRGVAIEHRSKDVTKTVLHLSTMYLWSMMKNIRGPNLVGIGYWGPRYGHMNT